MKVAVLGIVAVLLQHRTASAQVAPPDLKSESAATAASLLPTLGGGALLVAAAVMETNEGCSGTYVVDLSTGDTRVIDQSCRDYGAAVPALAAVGIAALLVGPTLGHVYAGKTWNTGLKVRLAGLGLAVLGGVYAASSSCKELCEQHAIGGAFAAFAGGGTYLVGTIIEIATASSAVGAHNRRVLDTRVDVVPMSTGTGTGAGFAVSGRF